jgi:RNA-splicing ligase RtcB
MRLIRTPLTAADLDLHHWDAVADRLRANKGRLGDLGGGNHFLDALCSYHDETLYFLIHTGSRNESGHVDAFVEQPTKFDAEFDRVVGWAAENRAAIQAELEAVFGRLKLVMDLPHNTYELVPGGGAIIRKGSVHVQPGDLTVIPSHMSGDIVLARATERVGSILNSLSHGTGRKLSRGDCKQYADGYDFAALRRSVLFPSGLEDASLRTEGPYAYRDLDECLALLNGYIEEVERFAVIGYMGHL